MAGINTLVFDVNETLLDLAALDDHFERVFGSDAPRREWFGLVLRNSLTLTVLDEYRDFATVATASLTMVADTHGVSLGAADGAAVVTAMANLPPHPDVPAALARLRSAGFQLAALTNSPPEVAAAQLRNAGLAPLFKEILSVHQAGRLKPHPAGYEHAARALGIALSKMMLVAAHDWDVAGAMKVGMTGALVTRPGVANNPLFPAPTLVAPDMTAMATAVLDYAG
jgi:2-haloacid dehalogenase